MNKLLLLPVSFLIIPLRLPRQHNTVDAVADVTDGLNDARKAIKRTDALVDASKAAKNVGNTADALDTANDASKGLKNVDSPTGGQNSFKSIKNRFPNEVQQGRLYEHKLQDGKIIKIQTGYREFDFVVTQNNELRIGSEHSFLANGEDVYAAGKMKVSSSGQITKVTNQSGHYTPTVEDRMSQFNDALKSSGVRTERAWMELYKFDMTNSGYVIGGGVREKMIKMK